MVDTFLNMAAGSPVTVLSGTHSMYLSLLLQMINGFSWREKNHGQSL